MHGRRILQVDRYKGCHGKKTGFFGSLEGKFPVVAPPAAGPFISHDFFSIFLWGGDPDVPKIHP